MTTLGLPLLVALVVLLLMAVAASAYAHLGTARAQVVAALRAALQLAAVSLILAVVLQRLLLSALFALVMLAIATATSARRIGAARAWPLVLLAIASGAVPVIAVILVSGAVPLVGAGVVPIAGIVIGNSMTASSLTGRRIFTALRDERETYEGALALGLRESVAIGLVIKRHLPEAMLPGLDQTRTVGLVTLPGAFVGVLLGGGSPLQAGAAQLLVLVGLLAAQTLVVAVFARLTQARRLLPADLQHLRPHDIRLAPADQSSKTPA